MELNKIYNIDCIYGLRQLEDESVDLILTSPPYDNLRDYKGYSFNFEAIAKELFRVIKIGGIVVWVVSDATIDGNETGTSFKQALFFKEIGFNLYDTMIYKKRNGLPIGSLKSYIQKFEYMFVFSKGLPKSINLLKDRTVVWTDMNGHHKTREVDGSLKVLPKKTLLDKARRNNVWEYLTGIPHSTEDKIAYKHPAIFPEELAKDHILSWSNEGDIVLDPMCGSGTTCKMALLNKRKFIGFDISKDYCTIAEQRIKETENRLKVIENQVQL